MKLKDFITQTLLDVLDGVAGAQQALSEGRGSISPVSGPHNPYQEVDFDLAVEAEGDAINVVHSNAPDIPRGQRSDISRIRVTVPVRLPTGKT